MIFIKYTRVVLILFLISHHVCCFNILAIISLPLKSHYMAIQPLFRELAIRGHSVTVMNNFPDIHPPLNLTFVDLRSSLSNQTMPMTFYEGISASYLRIYTVYRHIAKRPLGVQIDCVNLFESDNARAHLAGGHKFDVIFVEQFVSDCALAYAATFYEAPIIGIMSHVLMPTAYSKLGLPFDFASDAFYFSDSGSNPSLYDKIEATVFHFYLNTISKWQIHRSIHTVFNKYLPNNTLDIDKVAKERMKMMFVYQHFSLTGARLVAPQVLEIGGLHINGKVKSLPEDIEKFFAGALNGVIYISFGSNLKSSTMSKTKLQHFLDAFKEIPQKVLWKWENGSFPERYDNIYTGTWFSQLDVLCHPKVIVFVTQGGMLSLSEAVHCGKPVLTIPFFGDQLTNAASARAAGFGKTLYLESLNVDSLMKTIQELTSEKMQKRAKEVSELWHDRPQSPMDSAIYWTEYVARHRDSPPSLPSKYNSWFQSALLDVYFVLGLIIVFILFLIFYIFGVFIKIVKNIYCKRKIKYE